MEHYVYTLTSLTGKRRNDGRRTVFWGLEFNRRGLTVTACAVAASLIPAFIVSVFIGGIAFFAVPAIFIIAAFLLVETRVRNGLQVRVYQSILDKQKARDDIIYICWRPVDELQGRANIVASSESVSKANENLPPLEPVFTAVAKKPARGARIADLLGGDTE